MYWLPGILLLFVSAVGCADEPPAQQPPDFRQPTASPTPSPTIPTPSPTSTPLIDGFWAIYANRMDGTVVRLHADGNTLTGRGCVSGCQEPSDADGNSQCGELTGTIDGDEVSFEFYFGRPSPWDKYGLHAQLLEGGVRMNGEQYLTGPPTTPSGPSNYFQGGPVTVFRPPEPVANDFEWPWGSPAPMEVGSALAPVLLVTLVGDAPAGRFVPGASYKLETLWGGLLGELGVFAPVDLAYERPEAGVIIVHAGPAPQAEADDPIGLTIEIRDERVVSIGAELASGQKLSFGP